MSNDKRKKAIKIRVSEAEFERLEELKARPELARWIRELALSGQGSKAHVVKHVLPPEVVRVMAGLGNNLNQMAKTLNKQAKDGDLDLRRDVINILFQLQETERALNNLRELLNDSSDL